MGLIVKLTDDDPQPESTVWFTVDDILVIREFNAVDEVLKAYEAAER